MHDQGMIRQEQLVEAFVGLADTLVADFDVVELLQRLVEDCVRLLDAAAAGLLLADQRGSLQVLASTTEQARLLELFQLEADKGPCLACFRTGAPVLVPDLADHPGRWSQFATKARQEGFASVHALPLRLRTQVIGALNLFHTHTGAMTADDLAVGQALADVATIGILQQRAVARSHALSGQLQSALNSRVIIEQAKGVLAERANLDMDEAFTALRGFARNHNRKLVDVALGVIEGRSPTPDRAPS